MIKDLKLKQSGIVNDTFMVTKCEFKPFANKPGTFLSCEVSDKTGSIKAVMWDGIAAVKPWLKSKTVATVIGELSSYKDNLQLVIKSITKAESFSMSNFIPSMEPAALEAVMAGLDKYHTSIKNEECKKVWDEVLTTLRPVYQECPGGIGEVHHAYLGGLAEHSYSMMCMSEGIPDNLDRDIILTGCLIHDMGKTQCYNWEGSFEMTYAGRLLHHTFIGYGMLLKMLPDHTTDTFLKLAHIVVAHHEDEGIRKTMFPEATTVASLDAMNALINHALMFTAKEENKDPGTNWTRYCQLTGRQYYMPSVKVEVPHA